MTMCQAEAAEEAELIVVGIATVFAGPLASERMRSHRADEGKRSDGKSPAGLVEAGKRFGCGFCGSTIGWLKRVLEY